MSKHKNSTSNVLFFDLHHLIRHLMLSGKSRKFGTGVFGGQCLVQGFLWVLLGTPGIFLGFGFRPFHFKSGVPPGRSSRNYYQRLSLLIH